MDEREKHGPTDHRPDPSETIEDEPEAYDALDEAGMESFPGSDPIAVTDAKPLPKVGDVQE